MKSELMALLGDQLHWFIHLNWKQRLCVLYFSLNFCLIFSVSEDNLLWALFVVLNFGASVRLLKRHVPLNDLED
ncbi:MULTISPECIES: hypothetical protein [Bacteroides]|uniref:hypothetical protein n=1 Tax=Bacteroides TaxID=816 RepID=UPI00189BC558|nr:MULTISPECIES: hypothetical protein [Bacteroides]MDC2155717.1 hypothetical protein [Bacteroides thetaiotaomicron]